MISRSFRSTIMAGCFAGLATTSFDTTADAHPHEFVDMKIALQFEGGKTVTGIRYTWLFDEFFSASAVQPADTDGDGKPEQAGLDQVLNEILANIKLINYFTKFDQDAVVPKLGLGKPISASMVKRQFKIEFLVPFEKPVSLKGQKMTYGIYDDEFYIAMHHSLKDDAVKLVGADDACDFELIPPDPSDEVKNFASSLGKSESGGTDLGYNFAEWVVVTCP